MTKIAVWFGNSWHDKEVVHVMEEGVLETQTVIGDDGEEMIIEVPNGDVESWLNRTDMSFSKFFVEKEKLKEAEQKYRAYVAATWENPVDEIKIKQCKQEFLSFVQ